MKKTLLSIASAALLATPMVAQTPVYLDDTQPIEARVQDALSRMTLKEKVRLSYAQSKFSSPGVPRLGIPELYWSDGPHGVRMEINWNDWNHAGWTNDSITAFPALTALAATWNPEMSAAYGKSIGEEALYREKDVLLGPGVNIYRTPLNGRNFEYMGEDPFLAGKMAVPYIREVQKNGKTIRYRALRWNKYSAPKDWKKAVMEFVPAKPTYILQFYIKIRHLLPGDKVLLKEPLVEISAPDGVQVFLDSEEISNWKEAFTVTEGNHLLKFILGGYEKLQSFEAFNGKTYRFSLNLDVNYVESE